jgi:hypothetical protein
MEQRMAYGILKELIGVDQKSFQLEEHGKGVP